MTNLRALYDSQIPFNRLQSALNPVCVFGSMVYNLLHQIESNIIWFRMSIDEYKIIFSEIFENEEVMKQWNETTQMSNTRNLLFETTFKRSLITAVIAKLKMLVLHVHVYTCTVHVQCTKIPIQIIIINQLFFYVHTCTTCTCMVDVYNNHNFVHVHVHVQNV